LRPYRLLPTTRIKEVERFEEDDAVAIESVLEIQLNDKFLAAFVCTPGHEKQLALGYLFSSGLVDSIEDLKSITYGNKICKVFLNDDKIAQAERGFSQIRRFMSTECSAPDVLRELRTGGNLPKVRGSFSIKLDKVFELSKAMKHLQEIFSKTGSTHAAMIVDLTDNTEVIAEDLGRHNALDKAIGLAIESKIDLENTVAIVTGRLTADVVSKCSWVSIPLLVSSSLATDAGVKFAQTSNLTLIGAMKGTRARIYHEGAADLS
jgi:FdhD protein